MLSIGYWLSIIEVIAYLSYLATVLVTVMFSKDCVLGTVTQCGSSNNALSISLYRGIL